MRTARRDLLLPLIIGALAQVAGAAMTPSVRSNPARPDLPVLPRKGRSPIEGCEP